MNDRANFIGTTGERQARLLKRVAALLAQDEEVGELHGWSGAGFELAFDGSLILAEDVQAAARGQFAGLEIQQEIDFPGFKGIAVHLSAQELADQAFEAIELEFAVLDIICQGHGELIGGIEADL
jgi:hypothetical protein